MAKIKYTPAQKTAVFWNGGNLLLSAAAGSGKTAALTGRIVELTKKGEDIHEMLTVTYTKTAAAEMRGRISSALEKALAEEADNPEIISRISRAITKVPSAEVSTIHSFLYRTLKPYFPTLGLPQDTRIADDKAVKTLKAEIMRDLVSELFSASDERGQRFRELADIIGQVKNTESVDRELLEIENRLVSVSQNHTALLRYAGVLDDIANSTDPIDNPYGQTVIERVGGFLNHYKPIFEKLVDELEMLPEVKQNYGPCATTILRWLNVGCELLNEKPFDFDKMGQHFSDTKEKFPKLVKLSAEQKGDTGVAIKIFRDEILTTAERIRKYFFSWSADDIPLTAGKTAMVMRLCAEVLGEYEAALSAKKKEMSIVDYNDLEILGVRLFTDENGEPTAAAREIGSKYKYIFIDEYQDTNFAQDTVFRAISGEARRFMVGDIKQSIYRFRGAAPEVFSYYRKIWPTIEPVADIESAAPVAEFAPNAGHSLFMSENFRCDKPVTQLVNLVSNYMLRHGRIPYESGDELVYAKNDGVPSPTSPAAEICLVDSSGKQEFDPEAEYVADRIASMIGTYSHDGQRIICADDIAILLRSTKTDAGKFKDALARRGIPSSVKVENHLANYPSVMLLMCILNFIDNPLRDIYVTGALRSPVFGFTMSELVEIKQQSDSPLYLAILDKAALGDKKCAEAVAWLEKQKAVSRGMRVDKFLEYLIDETGIFSVDGIREDGAERNAINRICTIAADFEAGNPGASDLSAFLDHAAMLISEDDKEGGEGNSSGAVSIMTIHSSKGLEFPVCFVSNTSKLRNAQDERYPIIYHGDMGFGMYLPDDGKLVRCDTLIRRVIIDKIKQDSISEEMRLLYVALTRARDHLIVTAKYSKPTEKLLTSSLQAEFSDEYRVRNASSYMDWILEATGGKEREWLKISEVKVVTADSDEKELLSDGAEEDDISAATEEYRRRFTFEYPHGYLAGVPAKLTVSKLNPEILDDSEVVKFFGTAKKDEEKAEKPAKRPQFMSESADTHTAADRGTATHVFMQFCDFSALKEHGVRAEIDRLIAERFISTETAKLINLHQLERFAGSTLLDKMLRSSMVKREFRFNVLLDGSRFTSDQKLSEKLKENGIKLTVQGVVDCVFRDPDTGKLVLVDYKTDSISEEEWKDQSKAEQKLRTRHKDQLSYYREISSEMFGEEIEDALIYSTVLGKTIKI